MTIDPVDIVTSSPAETRATAARLATELRPGAVVALFGDLGAGKTVFVQGLAEGLGIREPVSSPTFALVQEYRAPVLGGWLFHLDLYRIRDAREALAFGVEEYLFAPDAVTAVEWAERITPLLQENGTNGGGRPPPNSRTVISVRLEHMGRERRRLRIEAGSGSGAL